MDNLKIKGETSTDELIFPADTPEATLELLISYVILQIDKRYESIVIRQMDVPSSEISLEELPKSLIQHKELCIETPNNKGNSFKHYKYQVEDQNVKMSCFNEQQKNIYNSEISIGIIKSISTNTRKFKQRKKSSELLVNPVKHSAQEIKRKIVQRPEGVPFEEVYL